MGLDEYILGLLAIVSGLAISEMIGGLHMMLFNRRRIDWDWLTPLPGLYIAYAILAGWWVSWASFHGIADSIMLGRFLVPVAQLVCLFLAARGVFPPDPPTKDTKLDLSAHYFAVKRYVWGAMAANSILIIVARSIALASPMNFNIGRADAGTMGSALEFPMLVFGLVYYLALAFVGNRAFHRIAVPLASVILVGITIGSAIRA